jgi:FkbM family methyltransferase
MITSDELAACVGRPDPTILELGANDGEHTAMFLDLFPQARIYAFEPDVRAAARFRARIGADRRVLLFEAAVGAVDGPAPFYPSDGWPSPADRERLPDGWDLSGSLHRPTGHLQQHPWCTFSRQVEVTVWSLDSWAAFKRIGDVDFIWADVQGAEGDVVTGGRQTLVRTRWFYTEFSDAPLYAGQVALADLQWMLPMFTLAKRYEHDALFRRAW